MCAFDMRDENIENIFMSALNFISGTLNLYLVIKSLRKRSEENRKRKELIKTIDKL